MAQVLVGEVVFKLKADADHLTRSLRAAKREVEDLRREQERLNTEMRESTANAEKAARAMREVQNAASKQSAEVNSSTAALSRNNAALRDNRRNWDNLTQAIGAFGSKIVSTLKIPALVAATTLAASAFGALAAGALALGQAVAPLGGLMIGYPAMFLAVGSSVLVLKSGLAGVAEGMKALASGDQGKIAVAFAKMNGPAREFTTTLFKMKEAFDLQGTASSGLMPGLLAGLRAASPLMDVLREQVFSLSKAIGGVGQRFGEMLGGKDETSKLIGYNRFARDLNRLGAMNSIVVTNLGDAFIGLVDALRSLMTTASPLIVWMSGGIRKFGEWAAASTAAARSTGRLQAFFARTALVTKTLGNTFRDLIGGLSGISKAGGSSMGFGFLESLEKGAAKFKEFTQSADGQNKIARYFRQAQPIIREFVGLLGDIVKMMGRMAVNPALLQVVRDIRERLVPAIESLASGVTSRLGPALVNAATAFVNFMNVLSFTPLVIAVEVIANLVNGLTKLIAIVPGLGTVVASMLALGAAAKVVGASLAFLGMGATATKLGNSFKYLGSAALIAAKGLGAFRLALISTGVGAAIVALGTLASYLAKVKNDSKIRVETGFEKFTSDIREKDPDRYGAALRQEVLRLKEIRDAAVGAADAKNKASLAGQNKRVQSSGYLNPNDEFSLPNATGIGPIRKAFQDLGIDIKTVADADKILAKAQKEANDVMAEAALEAARQKKAYEVLADAEVSIGIAANQADRDVAGLTTSMTAAATAAYNAVTETGNLVDIFNGMQVAEGANIFSTFKKAAEDTLGEARLFSANISRALSEGYDPSLISDLVSRGPKEAGPILDSLVRNATEKNVAFFNSYAETMGKIAFGVAEAARIMNLATTAKDSNLTQSVGQASAIAQAFANGTTSAKAIGDQLKISEDKVREIARMFGMKYLLNLEVNVTPSPGSIAAARHAIEAGLSGRGDRPYRPAAPSSGTVTRTKTGTRSGGGAANGGILQFFRDGGWFGGRKEDHIAQIAPAGAMRVWAEPETGGEAYIPLSPAKRTRSMAILKQTAEAMGVRVDGFAEGGFSYPTHAPKSGTGAAVTSPSATAVKQQTEASKELTDAARAAKKAAEEAERALGRQLQYRIDKLVRSLTDIRDKIQSAYEKVRDYRIGVRDAAVSRGALSNLAQGKSQPTSIKDVTAAIAGSAFRNEIFAKQVNTLDKKGVDKSLIQQIIDLGPASQQGAAMMASFAAASPAEIARLNEAQKALVRSGGSLSGAAGNAVNGNAEALLLKESQRQTVVLEKLLAVQQNSTTNASNSSLINSLISALNGAQSRGRTLGIV